jgi:cell wall-associated NlpC family hydrolase
MIWAGHYVGKPFRDGGRGPDAYDCWGLVRAVYRDVLGIDLPAYGEISAADLLRVRREIAAGSVSEPWHPVPVPRALDVCVMRLPTGRGHGHVGVMVDAGTVLHAEGRCGVAMEPVSAATIRGRVMGYWRHVQA